MSWQSRTATFCAAHLSGDNLGEVMEKRDNLISALERRMAQKTTTEALFTIRWIVV